MKKKTVRLGIVGPGLMGREVASAVARWGHLDDIGVRPVIAAVCSKSHMPDRIGWFRENFSTITQVCTDYREMLANPDVDAIYCAVPHHLHAEMYTAIIRSGKHLLAEKPFGIDQPANGRILEAVHERPDVIVRCSSEFPFFPAVQRIFRMIEASAFGNIFEVNGSFLHSGDLDPDKPLNWKRIIEFNGEYGAMGDLGMHVCHVPFRVGWIPRNVRAVLSNIVRERPDGKTGKLVPCETWDNATLLCSAEDVRGGSVFPLTLKMQRIAPGQKNTWQLEIFGTKASVRFSTKNPKRLELLEYRGEEQAWQQIDLGYESAFRTVTGEIFEFGFSDSILQMMAGFFYEVAFGAPFTPGTACVTPEEAAMSHRLFTAALKSHRNDSTEKI